MAGPISTFVTEVGGVIKGFLDTIVYSKRPNGGPLPFRPDSTPVSSFVAEVQTKAEYALRELQKIRAGISERSGRGGMSRVVARQARQVIRGASNIITGLNRHIQSNPTVTLAELKKTQFFSEGLGPMVQWLVPMMQGELRGHGPILAEWFKIAGQFRCLVFATIAVGGLIIWNHLAVC